MSVRKGFTLIELLVVIAIIGLLSSVIIASLNTARGKANDAAIKTQLSQMRSAAELQYDSGGSFYANVCDPMTNSGAMFVKAFENSAKITNSSECLTLHGSALAYCYSNSGSLSCGAGTTNSEPAGEKWAAVVLLRSGKYFCVDYTGKIQEQATRFLDTGPTTVHCL